MQEVRLLAKLLPSDGPKRVLTEEEQTIREHLTVLLTSLIRLQTHLLSIDTAEILAPWTDEFGRVKIEPVAAKPEL